MEDSQYHPKYNPELSKFKKKESAKKTVSKLRKLADKSYQINEEDNLGFHITEPVGQRCDICDRHVVNVFEEDGLKICMDCIKYDNKKGLA
jgi:hypothetical protein